MYITKNAACMLELYCNKRANLGFFEERELIKLLNPISKPLHPAKIAMSAFTDMVKLQL